MVAALLELSVGVVVEEVGAVNDRLELHVNRGSVGGQIYRHAGAGQRTDVDQIGSAR